jgi:ADP-ribosylglycohydrolase
MGVPWHESGTPAPYAGNGAAMRAGPLGLLLQDRGAMCRAAREQSRITHLDSRCAAGAAAVARAVAIAAEYTGRPDEFLMDVGGCARAEDGSVAEAIHGLAEWLALSPDAAARHVHSSGLDPAHMDRWRGISAFVTPSVLWSLYAFLRSPDDYWETVCTAVVVGGDTDTMAAIAGAISGARLGVGALPVDLVARVNDRDEWGADALVELARACERIAHRGAT